MIYVAGYCRVSTDREDQVNSFEAQQRYFRSYIDSHPEWKLWDIYADEGISGTDTKKRAQFNRMLMDARAGKFHLILTKEISRFSRNVLDTIGFTRELKAMGIGVLFMTENLNTLNPEAEMLLTFMGTIAQEESRRTSVRVKWGQTRQMEQGVVFGTSLLGYRVKEGKIRIHPEEAELVRLIFHKYGIEKKGTSVIARELENMGYCTRAGNSRWNAAYIIKILKNEKYVGDLVQKKSITPDYLTHQKKTNHGEEPFVVIREHHEPIVSRELWEIVQQELKIRNKKQKSPAQSVRYGFSGKIRCGQCGANFTSRCKYRKDGKTVRYWSCSAAVCRGRDGCDIGRQIRDSDADEMVRSVLNRLHFDPNAMISRVIKLIQTSTGNASGEHIASRIKRIEKKKVLALDSYFSGVITKGEMLNIRAQYDSQIEQLKNALETGQQKSVEDTAVFLGELLAGQIDSDILSKHLVESLTVYKDRPIELRLNHLPHVFCFD